MVIAKRLVLGWFAILCCACGPAPLDAESDKEPALVRTESEERRVAALSPEPAMPRIRASLSRSHVGLREELRPDGLHQIDLKGRFQHAHVAIRGENGRLHMECLNAPNRLDALMTAPRVAP